MSTRPNDDVVVLKEILENQAIYIDEDYDYKNSNWTMSEVGSFTVKILNDKGAKKLNRLFTKFTHRKKKKVIHRIKGR